MLQMQAGSVYTAFGASVGVNTQLEKGVSKDTSQRSTPKQSAYLSKAPRWLHDMLVDDARNMVRFSGVWRWRAATCYHLARAKSAWLYLL